MKKGALVIKRGSALITSSKKPRFRFKIPQRPVDILFGGAIGHYIGRKTKKTKRR